MLELVILIGLQAAGKTTFYHGRFAQTHLLVSKDLLRNARNRNRSQQHRISAALAQGHSVVVDNTNPAPADRAGLIAVGRAFHARVIGYYFPPDVPESLARNRARAGQARVPDVAIYVTAHRLQPPSAAEDFDGLFIVHSHAHGFLITPWPMTQERKSTMESSGEQRVLGEGKYLRLVDRQGWEFIERVNISGIVGIVAVTDADKLLLVEQFRPAMGKSVIELPAGLAGDSAETYGEDLAAAARRELLEETGYTAARMTFLTEGPPSSGSVNEIITLYLAEELTKVGAGGGDHTESIIVHEIPVTEVGKWLEEKRQGGTLIDMRIHTGLYFLLPRNRCK
ncbi:MAG TPA: AAA family ATPase [Armatimonadota bacterium]|jgi:ADP-ribose pyrophosphatase